MVFQLAYGLETVVLRVFNVYGPLQGFGEYGGVIAQFVRHLLVGEPPVVYGDGMQTRDFVYVDDVVEAVLMSLINSDVGGGVFNIGSPFMKVNFGLLSHCLMFCRVRLLRLSKTQKLAPRVISASTRALAANESSSAGQ